MSLDPAPAETRLVFGRFTLIPEQRRLLAEEQVLPIGGRAFDLLLTLIRNRDRIVSKDELLALVWSGRVVEEGNLTVHVAALRKLLGGGMIVTASGRGYRFVAPVTAASGTDPAAPAQPAPAADLPRPLTRLIGREADLAAVMAQLAERRLVTILGGGGMGKTRLALELAERRAGSHPDGVWFVELGQQADPSAVPLAIARALGIDVRHFAYRQSSLAWLAPRQGLLLLDNCEHLLEAVAEMVEAILRACPRITILATSREPLRAEGEYRHRLAPLALPADDEAAGRPEDAAAVRLFLEHARAVLGGYAPDAAALQDILAICRLLEGLPLALELAAPLLPTLPPSLLRQRLEQGRLSLARGRRTAPARQKTLQATIAWSLDLLAPEERQLLLVLAAAKGSWGLDAAEHLAGETMTQPALHGTLAALVDKSLVQVDLSGDLPRYQLPAALRLILHPASAAQGALAHWMVALCREAGAAWETMADASWHARYRPDLDTLRGSLDWALNAGGEAALGATLAGFSEAFWSEFASTGELNRWFDQALSLLPQGLPPEVEGRLWLGRSGWLSLGEVEAPAAAARAVTRLRQAGSPLELGRALTHQALHAVLADQGEVAAPLLREAEARLATRIAGKARLGLMRVQALSLQRRGEAEAAAAVLTPALDRAGRMGAEREQALLKGDLAELAFMQGRVEAAREMVEGALVALGPRRSRSAWVQHLHGALASYSLMAGDLPAARRIAADRLYATRIMGMPAEVTANLTRMGLVALQEGKPDLAARMLGFSQARSGAARRPRSASAQAVHDLLARGLAATMPRSRLAKLLAEGARLDEEQAVATAGAVIESPDRPASA